MEIQHIWQQFLEGLLATTPLEFIAVVFGIASVIYSRQENIRVYPTGIVNTTIYIYLSLIAGLYAEAGVSAKLKQQFVDGVGVFLPGNFLPQSFGAEVPSVELWQMARKFAGSAAATVALGKLT